MTEQDPNTPPEGQQPPPKTTPAPKAADAPKRFCAYDTTYLRFVGDVVDTRKDATAQAKDHGVKNFEIREV